MIKGDKSRGHQPIGPFTPGIDHLGYDMMPCGRVGCALAPNGTSADCERLCNATTGCAGYVFANASCSGKASAVCWTKSTWGNPSERSCRASRKLADDGHWAIKGGDANAGNLTSYWDGRRAARYAPMHKQGAIILGIGGDNSDGAVGTFYEGAITRGYSTDAADNAVQANVVGVGYGKGRLDTALK